MDPNLSISGLILDIDRFASHDGPGIRTAVFLKGCPLRCKWCHSPESQLNHPEILYQLQRCTGCWLCLGTCVERALAKDEREGRRVVVLDRTRCSGCGRCTGVCYPNALRVGGKFVSVGELVENVARDLPFFRSSGGGVTLSGGEPAMQPDFSYNFLLACQRKGIHTASETTGHTSKRVMSRLADVSDLLLYDVKLLDSELHRLYTGVPNDLILGNLEEVASRGLEIQIRVPCIPGINDGVEHIRSVARLARQLRVVSMALLPFNPSTGAKYQWVGHSLNLADKSTQSKEYMESLANACRKEGIRVQIGG